MLKNNKTYSNVLNIQKNKTLIKTLEATFLCLDLSFDGKRVATGGYKIIKIYKAPMLKIKHQIFAHNSNIICIKFSHDNLYLVTGAEDASIKLWRVKDVQLVNTFLFHSS